MVALVSACAFLIAPLLFESGCDDAYSPPCVVTARVVLVSDTAISAGASLSLSSSFDRAIATWQRRDLLDGGAADGASTDDASPDGGDAGEPLNDAPLVTGFKVVRLDAEGALTSVVTVPVPFALRQRRSSVDDIGIVPEEDNAFLIHWKETTAKTDSVGRLVRGASLKIAYVMTNGGGGSVTGPAASEVKTIAAATCDRCFVAVAFVSLGSESLAFVRVDPDRTDVPLGTPRTEPSFSAFRLRRDGTILNEPVPWLRLPIEGDASSFGGPPLLPTGDSFGEPPEPLDLSASVDREGRIAITAGPRAWLVDSSPRLIQGPVLLPRAPDVQIVWQQQGAAALAWSLSPTAEGRGGDPSKREIFTGLIPPGAAGVATSERASLGRTALAFDRRGDDIGVLFESGARDFFAWIDSADGRKRGGDLLLSDQPGVTRSEYGFPTIPNGHLVFARGGGRFTTLTLGFSELVTREIRCAK